MINSEKETVLVNWEEHSSRPIPYMMRDQGWSVKAVYDDNTARSRKCVLLERSRPLWIVVKVSISYNSEENWSYITSYGKHDDPNVGLFTSQSTAWGMCSRLKEKQKEIDRGKGRAVDYIVLEVRDLNVMHSSDNDA